MLSSSPWLRELDARAAAPEARSCTASPSLAKIAAASSHPARVNSCTRVSLWLLYQNVLQRQGRCIAAALVCLTAVLALCLLGVLWGTLILSKHLAGRVNLSLSWGARASF